MLTIVEIPIRSNEWVLVCLSDRGLRRTDRHDHDIIRGTGGVRDHVTDRVSSTRHFQTKSLSIPPSSQRCGTGGGRDLGWTLGNSE